MEHPPRAQSALQIRGKSSKTTRFLSQFKAIIRIPGRNNYNNNNPGLDNTNPHPYHRNVRSMDAPGAVAAKPYMSQPILGLHPSQNSDYGSFHRQTDGDSSEQSELSDYSPPRSAIPTGAKQFSNAQLQPPKFLGSRARSPSPNKAQSTRADRMPTVPNFDTRQHQTPDGLPHTTRHPLSSPLTGVNENSSGNLNYNGNLDHLVNNSVSTATRKSGDAMGEIKILEQIVRITGDATIPSPPQSEFQRQQDVASAALPGMASRPPVPSRALPQMPSTTTTATSTISLSVFPQPNTDNHNSQDSCVIHLTAPKIISVDAAEASGPPVPPKLDLQSRRTSAQTLNQSSTSTQTPAPGSSKEGSQQDETTPSPTVSPTPRKLSLPHSFHRFSLNVGADAALARLSPSVILRPPPLPLLNLPTLGPMERSVSLGNKNPLIRVNGSAVPGSGANPNDERRRLRLERTQSGRVLRSMPALPLQGKGDAVQEEDVGDTESDDSDIDDEDDHQEEALDNRFLPRPSIDSTLESLSDTNEDSRSASRSSSYRTAPGSFGSPSLSSRVGMEGSSSASYFEDHGPTAGLNPAVLGRGPSQRGFLPKVDTSRLDTSFISLEPVDAKWKGKGKAKWDEIEGQSGEERDKLGLVAATDNAGRTPVARHFGPASGWSRIISGSGSAGDNDSLPHHHQAQATRSSNRYPTTPPIQPLAPPPIPPIQFHPQTGLEKHPPLSGGDDPNFHARARGPFAVPDNESESNGVVPRQQSQPLQNQLRHEGVVLRQQLHDLQIPLQEPRRRVGSPLRTPRPGDKFNKYANSSGTPTLSPLPQNLASDTATSAAAAHPTGKGTANMDYFTATYPFDHTIAGGTVTTPSLRETVATGGASTSSFHSTPGIGGVTISTPASLGTPGLEHHSRPLMYKRASKSLIDLHAVVKRERKEKMIVEEETEHRRERRKEKEIQRETVGDESPVLVEHPSTVDPMEGVSDSQSSTKRQNRLSKVPSYEALALSHPLRRRRSMPMYTASTAPPPYPSFAPHPFPNKASSGVIIQPREDEGREKLPEYSNEIYLKAILPRKMEFEAQGVQAKDRKWRRVLCVLDGTALKIYKAPAGASGMSAIGEWWERKVGVGDVTVPGASGSGSVGRSMMRNREEEERRERERGMERVLKAEREVEERLGRSQVEVHINHRSAAPSPLPSPMASHFAQQQQQQQPKETLQLFPATKSALNLAVQLLKPGKLHARSSSDTTKAGAPRPPRSPRGSLNLPRGGSGSGASTPTTPSSLNMSGLDSPLATTMEGSGRDSARSGSPTPSGMGRVYGSALGAGSASTSMLHSRAASPAFMSASSSVPSTGAPSRGRGSSLGWNTSHNNSSNLQLGGKGKIPDPEPGSLIKVYSMQHAECGVGNDYLKRKNVIRVRLEHKEQFLLQTKDMDGVVEWIEGLQKATNVSLDLDERPMPRGPIFPRRRRRRRQPAASTTEANGPTTISST